MSVLVFDPQEAVEYGLNEAIVIQQMRYWLSKPAETREERDWIYNSYDQWQAQFPFWSVRTVRRTIESLEAKGLVISELRRVGLGSCKFYKLSDKLSSGVSKMDTPSGQNGDAINDQKTSSEDSYTPAKSSTREKELLPPASPVEAQCLAEMQNWPSYPYDATRDLAYLRQQGEEFSLSERELLAVCRDKSAWLEGDAKRLGSRLRFRNFCKFAQERKKNRPEAPVRRPSRDYDDEPLEQRRIL